MPSPIFIEYLVTQPFRAWRDIGKLAAIVIFRTALNYFLERELRHINKEKNNWKIVNVPNALKKSFCW
ncbi:MAG TPA: DUF1622 domain-containing protein [Chitinophagaceae bacterium]|nr:DUF1622 domain-containing protein [Chitinophagaceae bacterium]